MKDVKSTFTSLVGLLIIFCFIIIYNNSEQVDDIKEINDWETIFNGEDFDGWEIKIRGEELGNNFKNTFKVNDGSLKVSYENYENFDDRFGHIFYTKSKFKNYHLSLEYKFSGEHLKGAPGWSIKNSGIMLHSQHPSTMLLDQDFPVSSEVQLLGGLGTGERSTANMCSPGIDVDINSEKAKYHCVNSNSKTYHNDDWVKVEVIVKSNSIVHHIVENDTVISYSNLRVGGDKIPANYLDRVGESLFEGYVSLQSEGHPVEFRNIKIKNFCTDNGAFISNDFTNYMRKAKQKVTACGVGAHWQNGIAERYIGSITRWARTLLLHAMSRWPSVITEEFWTFAVNHAVNIHNATRQHGKKLSPWEMYTNEPCPWKPTDFQVFGSPVYV